MGVVVGWGVGVGVSGTGVGMGVAVLGTAVGEAGGVVAEGVPGAERQPATTIAVTISALMS